MPRGLPRPVLGLAASALAVGLLTAPMLAYADPTPTPTPATTAAAKSPASPADELASASPTPSTTESSTAASEPSANPSASPSADSSADSDQGDSASPAPTPEASGATPGRVGSDAVAAPSPSASETESAAVQAQAAAPAGISLTKTASRSSVSKVGQVITYTFGVRNTGGVPLTDVTITDELEGLDRSTCPESSPLAVGGTLTCTATLTVTQDWLDFGSIDNSATVFGSYPIEESEETDYVGANASAHVSVAQKPAISIDASVSPSGTADKGDRLRYTATATNTGNVTLTSARITSNLSKLDLDCDPSARATLAPGESVTCDGSYVVSSSDARRGRVSAKLTALANGPYDDQRPSDSVTLRTAVTKIASSSDTGLADTGGPDDAVPVGLLGIAALVGGVALVRRGRRA